MSTEAMMSVWAAVETDRRLNPADKLLLLRWAWKSRPGVPYEIRFKTVARELGLSRNGVKEAVRHLCKLGYLYAVAVKVVAGPALAMGSTADPAAEKPGGQPVTPRGSVSDPQRGHPVTPIKKKKKKDARASVSAKPKPPRSPHESGGAASAGRSNDRRPGARAASAASEHGPRRLAAEVAAGPTDRRSADPWKRAALAASLGLSWLNPDTGETRPAREFPA